MLQGRPTRTTDTPRHTTSSEASSLAGSEDEETPGSISSAFQEHTRAALAPHSEAVWVLQGRPTRTTDTPRHTTSSTASSLAGSEDEETPGRLIINHIPHASANPQVDSMLQGRPTRTTDTPRHTTSSTTSSLAGSEDEETPGSTHKGHAGPAAVGIVPVHSHSGHVVNSGHSGQGADGRSHSGPVANSGHSGQGADGSGDRADEHALDRRRHSSKGSQLDALPEHRASV